MKPTSLDRMPPPFDWIEIPQGVVTIKYWNSNDTQQDVPIAPFQIAKYPVTNAQFRQFIEADGYNTRRWWSEYGWRVRTEGWNDGQATGIAWTHPRYWDKHQWNTDTQPVVGVSWFEAVAFCLWLNDVTGENIMIPTETQWQFAAQGDDSRRFPWGEEFDCQRCNNNVLPCQSDRTTPVNQYEGLGDSPFGVVDMSGNVWELCLTDYDFETNTDNPKGNRAVRRGASWLYEMSAVFRCNNRVWYGLRDSDNEVGFRLART